MKNAIALIVWLASFGLAAQNVDSTERVVAYYKDGSVFVGNVVDRLPNHLQIRLSTLDTITLFHPYIKKIKSTKDLLMHSKGSFHFKTGYFAYGSISMIGDDEFQATSQLNLVFGKRLNEKWSVGVGGGLEYSDAVMGRGWVFHSFGTVFGYGRYYLTNNKLRPYIDSRLGYGFERTVIWNDRHSGGLNFVPGFGIHFATKNNFKWHIGISQYIQNTSGRTNEQGPFGFPITTEYNLWYNRTVIRVGFEIK